LLNEELFVKVKPGLSSYSHNPEKVIQCFISKRIIFSCDNYFYFLDLKAAYSIKPLLDQALQIVPRQHHKFTKITLKATAGLRLISEEIANKILNYVMKNI
jgi:Golgi nucleoside diphosphatase